MRRRIKMVTEGYFNRLASMSKTRFWINNPTLHECDLAITAGAINCTTNPTYAIKMIHKEDPAYIKAICNAVLEEYKDDELAAEQIQEQLVRGIMEKFKPLYGKEPNKQGFVSIQGDPFLDEDADKIISDALAARKLGKNYIAKIPTTAAGLIAIEKLIPENIPIIATEIMSVTQAVYVCELYQKISKASKNKPPFYVTHITGILDDHLKNVVKSENIDISPDILWQAGCIVGRKQYQILQERKYPGIMLGGGARGLQHFTEFVGGDMHITINWEGTADKLIENNPPVVYRIENPTPQKVVDELLEKIPDFRKAYNEGELKLDEFKDYGPVVLFRNSFIKGWSDLVKYVKKLRKE